MEQKEIQQTLADRAAKNAFMLYNHMEIQEIEPDRVVSRLDIRPESRNPFGMVHGGALYTLADNAAGAAAHTDGRGHVTQTSTLHFLGNVPEGTVLATATVLHRGRATCLVHVELTAEGKLLATGEFTFFCVTNR